MIHFPTRQELEILETVVEPRCVTIYLPSSDSSTADSGRIGLKNVLNEAAEMLTTAGAKPKEIKKTLRPGRELLDDDELWPLHYEDLALFLSPKAGYLYHIPGHAVSYGVVIGEGFYLGPLHKIIKDNKSFFVLALSHKNVRLYEGDHYQLHPLHLKNFPTDMKQALHIDEYPNWRETHNIAPASNGKGSQASHGQYNVAQTDKDMLLEFFRLIDKRLHSFLQIKQSPLIVAGVDYLMPIYRKANTYNHLLPRTIKGNLEHEGLDSIRKQAWSFVSS